ncbi:helix-turn-helix transcriptional regulator [Pseudomonas rhodesiae]|jgi:transcriptional regulator with XRE-family HTH domain|uniref:helix-turn-helix domain-containing protein n=1 Tax=Pseudomonas rhodesiae TaxID=76760 RepID=UPI0014735F5E|nr:helix-turn-helix transcriptional regulator [Pseudomonas rhodesiae]NMY81275.1 helix-turn-helix transcriptional regulator [Pseudomonas rhodesiae]
MNDTFGMRLARLRSKNGMTQRDLGAAVGVSWSQVSRYESGKAKPRLPILMKLADALGTDVEFLTGDRANDEGREITLMLSGHEEKAIEDFATKQGISFDQAVNKIIAAGMKDRMDKSPDLMEQLEAEIPGGYAKLLEMLGKKN